MRIELLTCVTTRFLQIFLIIPNINIIGLIVREPYKGRLFGNYNGFSKFNPIFNKLHYMLDSQKTLLTLNRKRVTYDWNSSEEAIPTNEDPSSQPIDVNLERTTTIPPMSPQVENTFNSYPNTGKQQLNLKVDETEDNQNVVKTIINATADEKSEKGHLESNITAIPENISISEEDTRISGQPTESLVNSYAKESDNLVMDDKNNVKENLESSKQDNSRLGFEPKEKNMDKIRSNNTEIDPEKVIKENKKDSIELDEIEKEKYQSIRSVEKEITSDNIDEGKPDRFKLYKYKTEGAKNIQSQIQETEDSIKNENESDQTEIDPNEVSNTKHGKEELWNDETREIEERKDSQVNESEGKLFQSEVSGIIENKKGSKQAKMSENENDLSLASKAITIDDLEVESNVNNETDHENVKPDLQKVGSSENSSLMKIRRSEESFANDKENLNEFKVTNQKVFNNKRTPIDNINDVNAVIGNRDTKVIEPNQETIQGEVEVNPEEPIRDNSKDETIPNQLDDIKSKIKNKEEIIIESSNDEDHNKPSNQTSREEEFKIKREHDLDSIRITEDASKPESDQLDLVVSQKLMNQTQINDNEQKPLVIELDTTGKVDLNNEDNVNLTESLINEEAKTIDEIEPVTQKSQKTNNNISDTDDVSKNKSESDQYDLKNISQEDDSTQLEGNKLMSREKREDEVTEKTVSHQNDSEIELCKTNKTNTISEKIEEPVDRIIVEKESDLDNEDIVNVKPDLGDSLDKPTESAEDGMKNAENQSSDNEKSGINPENEEENIEKSNPDEKGTKNEEEISEKQKVNLETTSKSKFRSFGIELEQIQVSFMSKVRDFFKKL